MFDVEKGKFMFPRFYANGSEGIEILSWSAEQDIDSKNHTMIDKPAGEIELPFFLGASFERFPLESETLSCWTQIVCRFRMSRHNVKMAVFGARH